MTIYEMLRRSVREHGSRKAFRWRERGHDRSMSYDETWERVREVRRGLAVLGIGLGDRVAILSENRIEWAICELAALCMGAITVPIYPTLPASQAEHLIRDSGARLLFVSDPRQLAKAASFAAELSGLETIVLMDNHASNDALTLADVVERGRTAAVDESALDRQAESVSEDEVATLIYTSGTTGEPKGAMLSHRALLHTGHAVRQFVDIGPGDVFLSFLPLSHVIERVCGYYLPLLSGATIVYSQGVFALASEFAQVHPTVFLCVPRVYEAMQERLQEHIARLPNRQRRLVNWALEASRQWSAARHRGRAGAMATLRRAVADRLVVRRIRERVLGARVRFLVSGGAPLSMATIDGFDRLGIHVLEGYGLTEIPVISFNRPGRMVPGSVGEPLPGIEVKLADDGEILARGPSLMKGYFGKPRDTADAIDSEGWFHTGDVGEHVTDGILRITDRKKDIIVLSNGKNVAPQAVERRLKESPYIAEAVLVGDRQSTLSAILVPEFDRLEEWARERNVAHADASGAAELLAAPEVRRLFHDEVERVSANLADFERVRRFALAPQPFTVDGGELTPTLKVRRRYVIDKYAALLESPDQPT